MFEGSSKRFFPHGPSHYLMTFKDRLHGASQTGVIEGTGYLRQAFTYAFYRILEQKGLTTHLTADPMLPEGIIVKAVEPVKLEIIVRNIARGHWVDAHKVPLFAGGERFDPPLVEFCLKCVESEDPRISPELAIHLNRHAKDPLFRNRLLNTMEEAEVLKKMALEINRIYADLLSQAGWTLEDFKFEVGVLPNRQFLLIDEISPDCSRIRDSEGRSLTKDLFRQRRPDQEIYQGYLALKEWIYAAKS